MAFPCQKSEASGEPPFYARSVSTQRYKDRLKCRKQLGAPNGTEYLEALAIVRAGQKMLAARPDVGMEGFELSGIDLWREVKYQQRRQIELRYHEAIRAGEKLYDSEISPGQ